VVFCFGETTRARLGVSPSLDKAAWRSCMVCLAPVLPAARVADGGRKGIG
jgi:hypothetical protein